MSLVHFPILSLLVWLPMVVGCALLLFNEKGEATVHRVIALVTSSITLLICLLLWLQLADTAALQFVERISWISSLNIQYFLGIDGLSLSLMLLSAFSTVLVIVFSWNSVRINLKQYLAAFLIMESCMLGVFAAQDAMLFYVFWEAMLIPMFIIIGVWGGERRIYAAIKFFLYTFLGSVFMLAALLYLYGKTGSFAIADFYNIKVSHLAASLIFWGFFAAFAVKIPMWPVHTWLPDAHVEAPTGGSVILAAVMLKMGGYGFLRFTLPIVPQASLYYVDYLIVLSLIAVVYIGFVAIVQKDMKKLIAYSSIAHMGIVTLGIFIILRILAQKGNLDVAAVAINGAVFQMLSHGFISAALFLCVGVLYNRVHTREISAYGGVANVMPVFAAFFMLFALANTGLPGTSGFVGEFMVLLSTWQVGFVVAFWAALTLVLSAAFTLWMYRKVMFGAVANKNVAALQDLTAPEKLSLGSCAFLVLFFGVYPKPIIDLIAPAVSNLIGGLVL